MFFVFVKVLYGGGWVPVLVMGGCFLCLWASVWYKTAYWFAACILWVAVFYRMGHASARLYCADQCYLLQFYALVNCWLNLRFRL